MTASLPSWPISTGRSIYPTSDVYLQRAEALLETGDAQRALASVDAASEANGANDVVIAMSRAWCLAVLDRCDEAMKLLNRHEKDHPESAQPLRLLLLAVRVRENPERAVRIVQWYGRDTRHDLAGAGALLYPLVPEKPNARRALELLDLAAPRGAKQLRNSYLMRARACAVLEDLDEARDALAAAETEGAEGRRVLELRRQLQPADADSPTAAPAGTPPASRPPRSGRSSGS